MSAATIAAKPARGRPPGRTAFQEEKRQQTRAAILEAAGELFAATPYVYATIDDIIRVAGISRATFYMHFESKLALALAIYDGIAVDWMEIFDRLPSVSTHEPGELTVWIRSLAALYVDHGYVTSLVGQLEIFESSFRQRLHDDRNTLIDRLGVAGVGGFVDAAGKGEAAFLQRARAHLLLRRIDQICGDLSLPDMLNMAEADAYVSLAVEELGQFIAKRP